MVKKQTGSAERPLVTWTDVIREMKTVSHWIDTVHTAISEQPPKRKLVLKHPHDHHMFLGRPGVHCFDPPSTPPIHFQSDKCHIPVRRRGHAHMEDAAAVLAALRKHNDRLTKKVRALSRGRRGGPKKPPRKI